MLKKNLTAVQLLQNSTFSGLGGVLWVYFGVPGHTSTLLTQFRTYNGNITTASSKNHTASQGVPQTGPIPGSIKVSSPHTLASLLDAKEACCPKGN